MRPHAPRVTSPNSTPPGFRPSGPNPSTMSPKLHVDDIRQAPESLRDDIVQPLARVLPDDAARPASTPGFIFGAGLTGSRVTGVGVYGVCQAT